MNTEHLKFTKEKLEIPEYDFEGGVNYIINKVVELSEKKKHIVVAFSNSGAHVGKTTLAKEIIKRLEEQKISSYSFHGIEEIESRISSIDDKRVFLFEQMDYSSHTIPSNKLLRENYDKEVSEAFKNIKQDIKGIDLWVGIYRPDKLFDTRDPSTGEKCQPIADIIIKNDLAINK